MSDAAANDEAKNKEKEEEEEEEPDLDDRVCPLCFEDLPTLTWRGTERIRLVCCGKYICAPCSALISKSQLANVMATEAFREDPFRVNEIWREKQECPFCRTKLARDDADRFRLVSENAKRAKPWALHKLGMYHKDGIGTEKDIATAITYFRKAAEAGYRDSHHELAECYRFGNGMEVDLEEAATWYEKPAALGLAMSQYQLANILNGHAGRSNVPVDHERAFQLLIDAAQQDYHLAQCDVAYAYEHGLGVPPSLEGSILWNRKAAMQGNVTAQGNLAGNYLQQAGIASGGEADSAAPIALFWAKKAAAAGDANAARLASQLEGVTATRCAFCNEAATPPARLKRCSRCKVLMYCSVEHQKEHWMDHKRWCKLVKTAEREYEKANAREEEYEEEANASEEEYKEANTSEEEYEEANTSEEEYEEAKTSEEEYEEANAN
jgi:TPR repeat protein